MRWLTTLCATGLMASTPLAAEASECGATLMEGVPHRLYRQLRLTPRQTTELQSIRYHSQQRQERLQRKLERVRSSARRFSHPRQLHRMQQQAVRLQQRLDRESVLGVKRIESVLTPWQHRRCRAYLSHLKPRPVNAWVVRRHRSERERRRVVHRVTPRVDRTPGVAHRTPRRVHRAPPAERDDLKDRRRRRRL